MVLFELCAFLRTPVYKLANEMPYDEYLGWADYLSRRPIGWREDDRTLKLLQSNGCKEKGHQIFHSLAQMKEYEGDRPSVTEDGHVRGSALKQSFLFSQMLGAVGGDKLDLS